MAATTITASTQDVHYSPAQRALALCWGALCHGTFVVAISAMAIGLFSGMRFGRGSLEGMWANLANLGLILQFALLHSLLLSARGRRWMSRLPLAGVAGELTTTTFGFLSSLQILAVFLLWNPHPTVWFAPTGIAFAICCVAYATSWLLLLKAMADSGLGLQTGALGWMAVWRNRKPEYPGYAMRGLYRISRQPIYVAFALILWTAPVWTPDHLLIALLWTAYCMIGPMFKERRFMKFYQEGYRQFSSTVPYWLPLPGSRNSRNKQEPSQQQQAPEFDIIIAGAGPVGMVLANLLGKDGYRVLVIEPRSKRSPLSRAIGVTAPTLQTLEKIGILKASLQAAVPIGEAKVFGDGPVAVGQLSFDQLRKTSAAVVSLPQRHLEDLLEQSMLNAPSVTYWTGKKISSHQNAAGQVSVEVQSAGESSGIDPQTVSARWLVACDGAASDLRNQLRLPTRRKTYRCRFAMADFEDHSHFGDEVRLYFTATGAVETFPLPAGKRRWIVQTKAFASEETDNDALLGSIRQRAHWSPQASHRESDWSHFVPHRLICDRFFHGRTLLCGDSAHVMSPIGGHGMNVGVGDAVAAHACLQKLLDETALPGDTLRELRHYDRSRHHAFVRFSRRAAIGMWMGTRTGQIVSTARARILSHFLSSAPTRQRIAKHFAMIAELKLQSNATELPAAEISVPLPPSAH